jgi:hypothetical protein
MWPGASAGGLFVGVALVLAGTVLLLAYQHWSMYATVTALLVLAAFPALLVPYERRGACWWRPHRPCMDPVILAWRPGVRLGMFLVFLVAALVVAAIGFVRERGRRSVAHLHVPGRPT